MVIKYRVQWKISFQDFALPKGNAAAYNGRGKNKNYLKDALNFI